MHSRLDPISTLDHVGLEADGTRSPVELEEQPARIAQHRARLIPSP